MEQEYFEIYDDMEEEEDHKSSKCRLCAKEEKSKYLMNIFGKDGRKYALDIKIRKCLPFSVCEDDGMPKGVCLSCINRLEVSSEFVESCLRAHHTLLSAMVIDPASAKEEMISNNEEEDDNSMNEVTSDAGTEEDSSEAETVQHEEENVMIKEEPMDSEDEPPSSADKTSKPSSLQSVDCSLNNANTKEGDPKSNVVATAVNSIPKSSSVKSAAVLQIVEKPSSPCALAERQVVTLAATTEGEVTKSTGVLQERLLEETELVIKDEPLGSPLQSYSPVSSEVEALSEPPDQLTGPQDLAAPPNKISLEESSQKQDGVRDCSICNRSFPEGIFIPHYQEHFNRKPDFSCSTCGKGFYTEAGFLAHKICAS